MASTGMSDSAPLDPRTALALHPLDPAGRAWLDEAEARVAARFTAVRALFPAVRRHCGRDRLDEHWTADEAARAVLLLALPLDGPPLASELTGLFRHGDPAEQRAVLRALPFLDVSEEAALGFVREALRGNDSTLIEAALGPYGAARLPEAEYRQAVLKCVFYEIALDRIAGLDTRADDELARMLADFAHERVAAGRDVPPDIWPVVRAFPALATLTEKLAAETRAATPDRREAAVRALKALQ
ncbi:EboA domain-containing protein [Streptomyces capitiformicae]|uniref:Uncharacterized protein n=1 Tax=Streptomyces capitiformicae TaxID=2014920 RepID=A0A918ZND1_9ACTN|nr:EboA domain-containing protein [Streptomyces capitiformicae]GHE60084.1 hypothetical protein GCM10017771_83180 [Streptomyces capitiformicae]